MKNLEEIYELVNNSTMILVINNNSKSLLNDLFNSIYKKYPDRKSKCDSGKGLLNKLCKIKDKLVRIDIDINKIQFRSSNKYQSLVSDYNELRCCLTENNAKLLFKYDLLLLKDSMNIQHLRWNNFYLAQYSSFDLIIFIDKDKIKIFSYLSDKEYNIDSLIRKNKLKKLQLVNEKESR